MTSWRTDKVVARRHGISKAMRQYAKRYGQGVESMVQKQKQCGDGYRRGDWRDDPNCIERALNT